MAPLGHLPIALNGEFDSLTMAIPKQGQGRKAREWVKPPLEMPLGEMCPHHILPTVSSIRICFALAAEWSLGSITRLKACGN